MTKNYIIFASTLIVLIVIGGCEKSSTTHVNPIARSTKSSNTKGIEKMEKVDIEDPNSSRDIDTIPAISEFTEEQRNYVIEIFGATRRVINGLTTLEKEEQAIFGEGQFFWPKDPTAPVKLLKSFLPTNFRMKGISLSFSRSKEESRWTRANLSIQPINFPHGIYRMDLPQEIFAGYKLVKVEPRAPSDGNQMRVNLFQFVSINDEKSLMTVEVSEGVSLLQDAYPSSFHAIKFQKLD